MNRGNEARKAELHRKMKDAEITLEWLNQQPKDDPEKRAQTWELSFDAQKELFTLNHPENDTNKI